MFLIEFPLISETFRFISLFLSLIHYSLPDSRSYSTFDWKSAIPSRTRSKSRISISSMDESESSLIMISSRPPSVRSRVVDPMVLSSEPDTFCVLPSRMRFLCLLITFLLVASLFAAIANSLQTAHAGSVSYCKPPNVTYTNVLLCPKDSMFVYYKCCGLPQETKCCTRYKLWLMAALICVSLAVFISLGFGVYKYLFC
ncbi:hypothetical protein PRIPAC_81632, partial [Pristionchus pacificus]|uniref:Uncharacterized protein n=1 Tax=Pristionchus pacificus TaxID=54126 RepID=A0A2A6BDY2_PRIPA